MKNLGFRIEDVRRRRSWKTGTLTAQAVEQKQCFCGLKSVLLSAMLFFALVAASTGNVALDWWTIGSGGTCTSAVYAVSGTFGHFNAGKMSGGTCTLEGGFWSIVAALQTPGAPLLSVALADGEVMVSWPVTATGWVLDQATTLTGATIPWAQVPANQYQNKVTHICITIRMSEGNRFYRLRKMP